ncbi:MAG: hypothetical protein ABF330_00985 [Lentimonas sp.]
MLLQVGAWTWMIASYSQKSTIEQAFKETFGGDRPCELCDFIKAVDESESENPLNISESHKLTLMLGLAQPIFLNTPRPRIIERLWLKWNPENAHFAVPTPPPRLA